MIAFLTHHKLVLQSVALLLTVIAVLPVYLGLQGGSDTLAWAGLAVVMAGMGLGLWVS